MGKGAGAAAGGAAGVEVSGAVVGEVCATLVAVAPNIEAIKAAASTRLSCEGLFMIKAWFPPVCRLCGQPGTRPRSDCKLLRSQGGVQLIVFFSAISETLKKEIYGSDKQCFCPMKTKGQSVSGCKGRRGNTNLMDSVCEWQVTTRLHRNFLTSIQHFPPASTPLQSSL